MKEPHITNVDLHISGAGLFLLPCIYKNYSHMQRERRDAYAKISGVAPPNSPRVARKEVLRELGPAKKINRTQALCAEITKGA